MTAPPREKGNTLVRLATALVVAPVALLLIWIPALQVPLILFVTALVVQGLREYCGMTGHMGLPVMRRTVLATGAGVVLWNGAMVMSGWNDWSDHPVVTGITAAFMVLAVARLFSPSHDFRAFAADVLGVTYIAGFGTYLVVMQGCPDMGPGLVTLLLVAVAWSDTGAYFIGRKFGKHKLAPVTSPKKSWEGAVGGVLGAVAATAVLLLLIRLFGWESSYPMAGWVVYLPLAAALAVVSQIGDLLESMIKREAGIKDSGTVFPGHGGVMDRCDGILFAAPALYYLYYGLVAVVWIVTNR